MKTIIRTGSVEAFFKQGREIARLADKGQLIQAKRVLVTRVTNEQQDDLTHTMLATLGKPVDLREDITGEVGLDSAPSN